MNERWESMKRILPPKNVVRHDLWCGVVVKYHHFLTLSDTNCTITQCFKINHSLNWIIVYCDCILNMRSGLAMQTDERWIFFIHFFFISFSFGHLRFARLLHICICKIVHNLHWHTEQSDNKTKCEMWDIVFYSHFNASLLYATRTKIWKLLIWLCANFIHLQKPQLAARFFISYCFGQLSATFHPAQCIYYLHKLFLYSF